MVHMKGGENNENKKSGVDAMSLKTKREEEQNCESEKRKEREIKRRVTWGRLLLASAP